MSDRVPERVRFVYDFALLGLALAADAVYNVFCLIAYLLLTRPWHIKRLRRIILHGESTSAGRLGAAAACLLAATMFLAQGCSGTTQSLSREEELAGRGAPGSFKRQVYELQWSAKVLADQSDARKSLEDDLQALKTEPEWKENLLFDVKHLFTAPDAQKSLESDLQALGDPDHRKHGLRETFEMLGW